MSRAFYPKQLSVSSLVKQFKSKRIEVDNSYQRELVWSKPQKQLLIDSLLYEIDLPKFYFHKADDMKSFIVDGQQRTNAIVEFFSNQFPTLEETEDKAGLKLGNHFYKDLPNDVQSKLDEYQITVIELIDYDIEEIKEIFVRHQGGSPLNAAEKRRGLPGNVPEIIAGLAEHKIFKSNSIGFKNHRFSYQDAIAKILYEFDKEKISTVSAQKLKDFYINNKNLNSNDPLISRVKSALNFLDAAFKNSTTKLKKVELRRLSYIAYELLQNYNLNNYKNEFARAFEDFQDLRTKDEEKAIDDQRSDLIEYRSALRNDSVPTQKHIHEVLLENIFDKIENLSSKDSNRAFTTLQRHALFRRAGGKCENCTNKIIVDSFEADHVIPWSNGGKTSLENGQALCLECNRKKSCN